MRRVNRHWRSCIKVMRQEKTQERQKSVFLVTSFMVSASSWVFLYSWLQFMHKVGLAEKKGYLVLTGVVKCLLKLSCVNVSMAEKGCNMQIDYSASGASMSLLL